jgi:hypothetical protein
MMLMFSISLIQHQITQDILSQFFPRWKARRQAGKRTTPKLMSVSSSSGTAHLGLNHPGMFLHHPSTHTQGVDEFSTSGGSSTDQTVTFTESMACKIIVSENFLEICRQVLEQRISRSSFVQQALFMILPRLAAFNKELFCQPIPKDPR